MDKWVKWKDTSNSCIDTRIPKKKARELKSSIDDLNLNCKNVIPVLAEQLVEEEDEIVIKSYGLDKLVEVTYQVIPKEVKKAFVNVQKVDIKKRLKSRENGF